MIQEVESATNARHEGRGTMSRAVKVSCWWNLLLGLPAPISLSKFIVRININYHVMAEVLRRCSVVEQKRKDKALSGRRIVAHVLDEPEEGSNLRILEKPLIT